VVKPRSVDEAIARFDDIVARYEGATPAAIAARRRQYGRSVRSAGKRLANMGIALGVLIVATIAFGLIVGPIGWSGLFLAAMAAFILLFFFSVWPTEPKQAAYSEQLPTKTIVQQLDSYLVRKRQALPSAAAQKVDAIGAQLPLLETRLSHVDQLDPLAQDARRLMGKHLPELIARYERIPSAFRAERDAEGHTVDERLVASLDAAKAALDDIGSKLARDDVTAFETQGRFIESRYKDADAFKPD
jgi:hypothetical protein